MLPKQQMKVHKEEREVKNVVKCREAMARDIDKKRCIVMFDAKEEKKPVNVIRQRYEEAKIKTIY